MTQLTRTTFALTAAALAFGAAGAANAVNIVNDTWTDGNRTDPAQPVYSENGIDGDADGLESAWYGGGTGSLTVPAAGTLRMTTGASSAYNATTYFTPDATPVTLAAAGDQMKVTWVFTPSSVAPQNSSTGFRIGIVNSAARLTTDAAPPGNNSGDPRAWPGYAMIGNMGTTLGNSNPFGLYERIADGDFLVNTTAQWASRNDQEDSGTTGYAADTQYTFVLTATRTLAGELDIVMTMSGGSIGGDGQLTAAFLDATPASFSFDTFGIRANGNNQSAGQFDTSLFRVEYSPVPEPASLALMALGSVAMLRRRA